MRRPPRRSLAILLPLAVAACTKQGDPGPPPVPAAQPAPRVLAEASAGTLPLTVQVLEARRTGPDVLTVWLQLVNTGGPGQPIALGPLFAAEAGDRGTLADMYLWDEGGQRRYYVLRDTAGRPRGSAGMADLEPGAPLRVWAAFPAPAPGTTRLTVCVPRVPPMRGVPIS